MGEYNAGFVAGLLIGAAIGASGIAFVWTFIGVCVI